LKTIKRQYIYSSIEDSEVVLVFERNKAGLQKLSQVLSEQKSDSSAFLNSTCLLKYVLNSEQHFSFFIFRSGLTVTGLVRVHCNIFEHLAALLDNVTCVCMYVHNTAFSATSQIIIGGIIT
jgi:hypothetical protein